MPKDSEEALNLAHVLVERKGILKAIRTRLTGALEQRAIDEILRAVQQCEAAWAECERKS